MKGNPLCMIWKTRYPGSRKTKGRKMGRDACRGWDMMIGDGKQNH